MDIEKLLEEPEIDPRYREMFKDYDDVLTVPQVCEMLKLDRKRAYQYINSGEMKSIRYCRAVRVTKIWVIEFVIAKEEVRAFSIHKERQEDVLQFCAIRPRSGAEIQHHLGISDKNHMRNTVLKPLLESGQIQRTLPDKPCDTKQKYYTVKKADR